MGVRWIISSLSEKHIQLEGGHATYSVSPPSPPLSGAAVSHTHKGLVRGRRWSKKTVNGDESMSFLHKDSSS